MPGWLVVLFAIIGALASVIAIAIGSFALRDRLGYRLIVHVWWQLALNPVHTRHIWHDIGIAVVPPVPEDEERVKFRQFDGVWDLRLLVYNPSQHSLDPGDADRVLIAIQRPTGIEVLFWRNKDHSLVHHRTESEAGVNQTIRLNDPLRPKDKVRDNLPVTFMSRRINKPPEIKVDLRSHVRSRVKLHRPSVWYSAAGRLLVRALRRLVGRAGSQPRLYH